MEEHEPIVERIIHRLVRKHIAGTTMESALDTAKELSSRNIPASLTFLSANVVDRSKAKYVTTTYTELVRRIARSGIKASVHLSLEQIGSNVDEALALENLNDVIELSNKYGVWMWIETDGVSKSAVSKISKMKGVGLALDEERASDYNGAKMDSVKLICKDYDADGKGKTVKLLDSLKKSYKSIILSSAPEKAVKEVIKSKYKNDVMLEFSLGYSDRKISKAVKRGARVSILVPFGKDWIKYAMNNVPEGYMRFVAGRLLKEDQDVA